MANENAVLEEDVILEEEYVDFEDLEEKLQNQLDEELSDLSFLETEKDKIGNPDNLGNVIKDVVWEQFLNQIAVTAGEDFIKENRGLTLDLRNEAHIQTSENFAEGKIATHNYMSKEQLEQNYDRYKNKSHKEFRKEYVKPGMDATLKRAGDLKKKGIDTVTDIYNGRQIPTATKLENGKNNPKAAQREHVNPSAKLYKDPSLQMANSNEELAAIINNPENLQGYTTAERNNRKSDNSTEEMASQDKNKHYEKAKQRSDEYIESEKKKGEDRLKKEGKKSQREEAFRIGGKALRAVLMQMLAELIKEIIGKLVKWFKSAKKQLSTLLESLKEAIHSFIRKMKTHLINAGNTIFSTVATAIIGPIFGIIKKVWMMLKQGWNSLKNAVNYIKDPMNKDKPVGILLMEVGKIVIAGVTGIGALVLGEVIEKSLMTIPIFAFEIPLLGSLANILGIFLGAIVAGIIGAIAINMMDKVITKQKKAQVISSQVDKGNEILQTQREILNVNEKKLVNTQEQAFSNIQENHKNASQIIKTATEKIFAEDESDNQKDFDEIDSMLDDLLA